MPKIINEIGNQYDNLLVIDQEPSVKGRRMWKCQCQLCKRIQIVSGTTLRSTSKKCCDGVVPQYNKLTILEYAYTAKDRHIFYRCKCECGNTENIKGTDLFTGVKKQCSICSKKPAHNFIDETDNTYGFLHVLERDFDVNDTKNAYWKCRCKCGNTTTVLGSKLRSGHTVSCGCIISKGEQKISQFLMDNNIDYKTQVSFSECNRNGNLLFFDFAIYKDSQLDCLIEFDGVQHFTPVQHWGGEEKLQDIQERDSIKNKYCIANNIPLIRIPYHRLEKLNLSDLQKDTTKYLYKE